MSEPVARAVEKKSCEIHVREVHVAVQSPHKLVGVFPVVNGFGVGLLQEAEFVSVLHEAFGDLSIHPVLIPLLGRPLVVSQHDVTAFLAA